MSHISVFPWFLFIILGFMHICAHVHEYMCVHVCVCFREYMYVGVRENEVFIFLT